MILTRRSRHIVFLDRDDTLIKDRGYLNAPHQVELLPHVTSALKFFRDLGFEFVVTTNQSGLTRGKVQIQNMHQIHTQIIEKFQKQGIRFLDFYYAPYYHEHWRRKPQAGLFLEAAKDYNINLKKSVYVGDKWRDLVAGHTFGGSTLLINEAPQQRALFKTFAPTLILKNWTCFNPQIGSLFDPHYNRSFSKSCFL